MLGILHKSWLGEPGVAICLWCEEMLHYSSSGKKRIKLHAVQKNKKIILENAIIPVSWIYSNKVAEPLDVCSQPFDLPYSVAVNFHDSGECYSKRTSQSKPVASVKDCMLNTKAFILPFVVENSLPLSCFATC